MKIGLLSDTHGWLDKRILHHFRHCDEVWHAGDIGTAAVAAQLQAFKPLRAVYGNIDGQDIRITHPKDQFFECQGLQVWMTHIGGRPPRYTPEVQNRLQRQSPDLFICGHSHILCVMRDPQHTPLLYLNPGAAGRIGAHKVRTILRFDIHEQHIHNMEAIELGTPH